MDLDAEWAAFAQREQLIAEVGNVDLARQMFIGLGAGALTWLDAAVPALGGRTPRSCLRTRQGRKLLGRVLARLPR